jgi:hypothetical protein
VGYIYLYNKDANAQFQVMNDSRDTVPRRQRKKELPIVCAMYLNKSKI